MNRGWKVTLMVLAYITWFVVGGIMVESMWDDALAPLALLQIFMMAFIYMVARSKPVETAPASTKTLEKNKRDADPDAKMRLLLEMMDDDERYAFKEAMKARMLDGSIDGELNYDADSLGALLEGQQPMKKMRR